jgi:hypothetical protein
MKPLFATSEWLPGKSWRFGTTGKPPAAWNSKGLVLWLV